MHHVVYMVHACTMSCTWYMHAQYNVVYTVHACTIQCCVHGTCMHNAVYMVYACNRDVKHKLVYLLHRHEAALLQARQSLEKQSAAKLQAYEALLEVQVS